MLALASARLINLTSLRGMVTVSTMSNDQLRDFTKQFSNSIEALAGGDPTPVIEFSRKTFHVLAEVLRQLRSDGTVDVDLKELQEAIQRFTSHGTKATVRVADAYADFVKRATGVDKLGESTALEILRIINADNADNDSSTLASSLWSHLAPVLAKVMENQPARPMPGVTPFPGGSRVS